MTPGTSSLSGRGELTDGGTNLSCNMGELSGWVPLMPHLGNPPLFEQIDQVQVYAEIEFQRFGPRPDETAHPDIAAYYPWYVQPRILLCPSDPNASQSPGRPGQTSYRLSWGDVIANTDEQPVPRGVFGRHSGVSVSVIMDGTSNTVAIAERAITPANPPTPVSVQWGIATEVDGLESMPQKAHTLLDRSQTFRLGQQALDMSGMMWANGRLPFGGVTTVLAPNAPAALGPDGAVIDGRPRFDWGVIPPSSYHPGGVNVLLADGSCSFISETINCYGPMTGGASGGSGMYGFESMEYEDYLDNMDEVSEGPSPYGIWGALGSIRGEELVGDY